MAADLTNFIRDEIEPRLWNGAIKDVFPEMQFEKRGNEWQSPFKLGGTPPTSRARNEKSKISEPTAQRPRLRIMEQGGESMHVFDYYMQQRGMNIRDKESILRAAKELAEMVGAPELPQGSTFDAEAYRKRQEKQDRLSAIFKEMKAALFAPEGEAVLKYLKEERGYSEEYIKAQDFGYISSSMPFFDELIKLLTYDIKHGEKTETKNPFYWKDRDTGETKGIGGTHTFAIAYVSSGEIKGFEFRSILTAEQLQAKGIRSGNKYAAAFISEAATQKYNLFGLTGLRLTSERRKDKNITIVEGELDALRGLYAGIPNVVAASQGSLTKEQLENAKGRGVEEVTLLFDTEAFCESDTIMGQYKNRVANWLRCMEAIKLIEAQGLRAFVLYLNESSPEKTDLDSYLKGLDGEALQAKGREVQEMILNADSANVFLFRKYYDLSIYYKNEDKEGETKKDLEDLDTPRELLDIETEAMKRASSINCPLSDRQQILRLWNEMTHGNFTEAELMAEASRLQARADKQRQKEELAKTLREESEKAIKDPRGTIERLKQQLPKLETITEEEEFREKYLKIETEEEEDKRRQGKELGILTNLIFKAQIGTETEQLLLPSGALTYICAPTSHGKSRLLENLALQVADTEQPGAVLFFSVEEDADAVQDEFLSIFIGEKISDNNLRTIRSARSARNESEASQFFKGDNRASYHKDLFETYKTKKKEFRQRYIDSGKLRIYYEEGRDADRMQRAIRYLNQKLQKDSPEGTAIKAVFIDYVQKMKKRGDYMGNRKEELTAVTEDLMNLSIEMNVPFILAVQLNREALSPLEMDLQDIADASEIEHSGNTIILAWNSNFEERTKSSAYRYKANGKGQSEKRLTKEALKFEERTGITLGQRGKIYLFMAKNRKGIRGTEAVLDFDGNIGAMNESPYFLDGAASASQTEPTADTGSDGEDESLKELRKQIKQQSLQFDETQEEEEEEQPN